MLRRKVGILFLIGITVLAGTPEAARQFDGLKSSLKNFTRASLWSGLIVYAQPVSDGKLPAPQIYYLMPTPSQPAAPAAQQPLLADNNATATRPESRNNHGGEVVASNSEPVALVALETAREVEDAAKSELALNKLPLNLIATHLVAPHAAPHFAPHAAPHVAPHVAPKPDKVRVFDEVARNEAFAARKLKHDADVIVKAFAKELDAEKIVAEAEHIVAVQAQLERLKSKNFTGVENLHRRMELRAVRRATRHERPDRIRVLAPLAETRGGSVTLSDISSIGCEKTRTTPEAAPAAPIAPAPLVKTSVARTSVQAPGEPAAEPALPVAPSALGNSWTLNCDTEPEQK
jgi:hypothetical protein